MKKVCTGHKMSHPTLTHVPVTHLSNWPNDASVEKMPARVSWLHVKVPLMACNKPYQGTQKPCVPVPELTWRQKENPWREADWWPFFYVGGFWESYKAFMEPSQIEFPNRDKTWHLTTTQVWSETQDCLEHWWSATHRKVPSFYIHGFTILILYESCSSRDN